MPIKFACEKCDKSLSVSSSKIGRKARCPRCGEPLTVPDREAAQASLARRDANRQAGDQPAAQDEEGEEDDTFSQFVVYDDTALVYDDDRAYYIEDAELDRDRLAIPRAVLYAQGILLGVVAVVFLVIGIAIGRGTSSDDVNASRPQPCIVSGLVTYKGSPDAGSVVLFLPSDGEFESPPNIADLRPESPRPGSSNPTYQAITSIGGAYGRVDREGRYQVKLDDAGKYYVLFLSRSGEVGNGELTKTQRAQIGKFFFPPENLVRQNHFRWITASVSGDTMELDEVVF